MDRKHCFRRDPRDSSRGQKTLFQKRSKRQQQWPENTVSEEIQETAAVARKHCFRRDPRDSSSGQKTLFQKRSKRQKQWTENTNVSEGIQQRQQQWTENIVSEEIQETAAVDRKHCFRRDPRDRSSGQKTLMIQKRSKRQKQ